MIGSLIGKCKLLHFGYRNAKSTYSLGGDIVKTDAEKRIEVLFIVAQTLKFSSQCVAAAKSANKTL